MIKKTLIALGIAAALSAVSSVIFARVRSEA